MSLYISFLCILAINHIICSLLSVVSIKHYQCKEIHDMKKDKTVLNNACAIFSLYILISVLYSYFSIHIWLGWKCWSTVEMDNRLANQFYRHRLIDFLRMFDVAAVLHVYNRYNLLTSVFSSYQKEFELKQNRDLLCIELSSMIPITVFDESLLKTKIIES